MTTSSLTPNTPSAASDGDTTDVTVPLPAGVGIAMAVTAIILGFLMLRLPITTLVVVALLFGINLIFLGAFRIAIGVGRRSITGLARGLTIAFGLITFIVGVACLANPATSLSLVAILLAVGWISDGLSSIIGSVRGRGERPTPATIWSIAGGAISIVAGLVVAFAPASSLLSLTLFSGILLIVLGVSYVITAIAHNVSRPRARG